MLGLRIDFEEGAQPHTRCWGPMVTECVRAAEIKMAMDEKDKQ